VGFLDDLKRQADAARAAKAGGSSELARTTALTDAACKAAFAYLASLAQQLNVLQPPCRVRYAIDSRHVLEGLRRSDFSADARLKRFNDGEVFDHVVLNWRLRGGPRLMLSKDFLPDIERLEARLRQGGVQVQAEAVRNHDNGKLLEMRYEFAAELQLGIRLTPDHEHGLIRFTLVNLDGFETVTVEFPAIEVGTARLDELARWIVGEPHAFLKDGRNLRRVEA